MDALGWDCRAARGGQYEVEVKKKPYKKVNFG
jgi:hypothetical protein